LKLLLLGILNWKSFEDKMRILNWISFENKIKLKNKMSKMNEKSSTTLYLAHIMQKKFILCSCDAIYDSDFWFVQDIIMFHETIHWTI